MSTAPITGLLIINGKALDCMGNQWATPMLRVPNPNNINQQWIYYPDQQILQSAAFPSVNNGWVCLRNDTLNIQPAWANPQCYWTFSGPNCTGNLQAAGNPQACLIPTADGASVMLGTPPGWSWEVAAPPPAQTMLLGEFGDDPADFAVKYLGGRRAVDYIVVFGDPNNLGISWAISQMPPGIPGMFSLCLVPNGGTLAQAVAGAYDSAYQDAAASLAQYGASSTRGDAGPNKSLVMARIGWEMNGDWYPWSGGNGQAANYVAAFQRYVNILRQTVPGVKIIWCPNRGVQAVDPATCYPGDQYVDIVGIDCYENGQWDTSTDATARFAAIAADTGRSLTWIAGFAAQHNKPLCIPEWGSNINGSPYFQLMHDWMKAQTVDVFAQSVWDNTSPAIGTWDFVSLPLNGPIYQAAFESWPN